MQNKKAHANTGPDKLAFSFVEIIITVSIIALLAVIGISSKHGYDENMNNTKVVADITTINNALTSFSEETKTLPMPGGNTNFYSSDTSYQHSYTGSETFGVYGSLTEETLAKKYLDMLPLDPRTNSYYAYGKTKATNEFEIASIQFIDTKPVSKVIGNYSAENGPYNLIREYNGPNFVYDKSNNNFPYNPEELVLIATDENGVVYREGDTINSGTSTLEIFFSDGSVSILEAESKITLDKLNFPQKDNLNTLVKISLGAGTIWTRATKLNDQSTFEVYTTDTIAAVRGTIFGVSIASGKTEVTVIEGIVDTYEITFNPDTQEVEKGPQIEAIVSPQKATYENGRSSGINAVTIIPTLNFSISTDIRDTETVQMNLINNNPSSTNPITYNPLTPEDTTCNKFEIGGIIECVEADETLKDDYDLVAYAPYDKSGDLNMYRKVGSGSISVYSGGILNSSSDNSSESLPTLCDENSFCEINGVKGVFIGNGGMIDDYIKYTNISDLNLGSNFAIEMSVRGEALRRDISGSPAPNFYLFNSPTYRLYTLDGTADKLALIQTPFKSLIPFLNYFSVSELNNNSFYKVIFKKDGNNGTLSLNGYSTGSTVLSGSLNLGTTLNIGSTAINSSQWNDIIDYVKIYKKP